jgi:hypothetical protein
MLRYLTPIIALSTWFMTSGGSPAQNAEAPVLPGISKPEKSLPNASDSWKDAFRQLPSDPAAPIRKDPSNIFLQQYDPVQTQPTVTRTLNDRGWLYLIGLAIVAIVGGFKYTFRPKNPAETTIGDAGTRRRQWIIFLLLAAAIGGAIFAFGD